MSVLTLVGAFAQLHLQSRVRVGLSDSPAKVDVWFQLEGEQTVNASVDNVTKGVTREISTLLMTWQFGSYFGRGFCATTRAPPIWSQSVWSEMVTDRPDATESSHSYVPNVTIRLLHPRVAPVKPLNRPFR
jgi:hypothetical protein